MPKWIPAGASVSPPPPQLRVLSEAVQLGGPSVCQNESRTHLKDAEISELKKVEGVGTKKAILIQKHLN